MTTDYAVAKAYNLKTGTALSSELRTIKTRQDQLRADREKILQEPNPFKPTPDTKANRTDQSIGFFAGADHEFVKKEHSSELKKSATALAITIGLGTYAFTKYVVMGWVAKSSIPGLALGIGVLATFAALAYFDRSLMQRYESLKLTTSHEFQKFAADIKGDYDNFVNEIGKGNLAGTFQAAQSSTYTLTNLLGALYTGFRLAIIGGGATLAAVGVIDDTLVGDKVDIKMQAAFDHQQGIVDPNDGIETQAEIILDVKQETSRLKATLSELSSEKADLESQISGYELSPAEQDRMQAIDANIAKLEAEKTMATSKEAAFKAEMVKEEKGADGAVAGKEILWTKAEANAAVQTTIIEEKEAAIAEASATQKGIIETAKARAADTRSEHMVAAAENRLNVVNNEITELHSKISERADPEAFAKTLKNWPEFNPQGWERFDPVLEELLYHSGTNTKIIAGMVGALWIGLEASALISKWQQKEPHNATLLKAQHDLFESSRRMKLQALDSRIKDYDAEKIKLQDKSHGHDRKVLDIETRAARQTQEAAALHTAKVHEIISQLVTNAQEADLEGFDENEIKAMKALASQTRQHSERLVELQMTHDELEVRRREANLNHEKARALTEWEASMAALEETAVHIMTSSGQRSAGIAVEIQNAQTSMTRTLQDLGNDPAMAPLKTAIQENFAARIAVIAHDLGIETAQIIHKSKPALNDQSSARPALEHT